MDIVISIQKKHVLNIHKGLKKKELRHNVPSLLAKGCGPLQCHIYEPKNGGGCGKIVGYFTLPCYEVAEPERNKTDYALSDTEYQSYMNGKNRYAWEIKNACFYMNPLPLSDFGLSRPPQAWCYILRS